MKLPAPVLFGFAALCSAFAVLMWLVFLRPAVTKTAQGRITHKVFKPAGEYVQYPTRAGGTFYAPSVIAIAECYVFVIQMEGSSDSAGYSLNTLASREFEPGQTVKIEYQERGVTGIWRRIYITKMSRP
jgi:hypothetical protein